MKYPELTDLCKNCTGCNQLANVTFVGISKCEYNENGLEQCKKIIEQMKMEDFKDANK